ncbi:translation initiation factor 3 subunit M [Abortiporus biennis]
MSSTDAVSVFAEGTFEEQILELVTYLARPLTEEERTAYIQPFQELVSTPEGQKPLSEDVDRQRTILNKVLAEVKGLGDGSERESEGFFNLLFAHLLSLFPVDSAETKQHLTTLLQTISSSEEQPSIKYRIWSNLFNTIPRHSGLRFVVHKCLVEIASSNDELEQLQLTRADVDKWLSEWNISAEDKSAYLKTLVDVYEKSGDVDSSYQYKLSYVRSLPSSSAQSAALDVIASALRLPSVFDFDSLFRLDAVVSAKDDELFSLLQIFLNDGLSQYKAWEGAHADVLSKYNLDKSQLERKIRLLGLATLGFQNVGRDLTYTTVATALQVEPAEVEKWVIDAIRAGLISGKLSQTTKTLHITRATARSFEKEQWEVLEKRLLAWKSGLAGVLEVVAAAKKKNGPPTVAATAVATEPQTPALDTVQQPQETAA